METVFKNIWTKESSCYIADFHYAAFVALINGYVFLDKLLLLFLLLLILKSKQFHTHCPILYIAALWVLQLGRKCLCLEILRLARNEEEEERGEKQ